MNKRKGNHRLKKLASWSLVGLVLGLWGGWNWSKRYQTLGCKQEPVPLVELNDWEGRQEIRFVAIGDAGTGESAQLQVAQAMAQTCQAKGCDFVLLLGDNHYPRGVTSVNDPQFQNQFEIPYKDLDLPFLVVLGNHDIKGSPEAQKYYSLISNKWKMPDFNYHFKAGPVEFYGLNSNCSLAAWSRLYDWLGQAGEPWQVVFQHHNFYSSGAHGNASWPLRAFFEARFGNQVDLVISGHEHQLEHLKNPNSQTDYLISGGGGQTYGGSVPAKPKENSLFLSTQPGFMWVQAQKDLLEVEFFDLYGAPLYRYQRRK
ncbi:MAG: hypothetical protein A2527_06085 [Candidatus Lambdaproteobacteria bacterium RIFOXYD2_FULL_50_16]|uniref:Calcineurin-like phosphoesterase domain-containing protein n=1 Tax=Candidatus Lambdaproteobacteria bacterium RIFOXYD2_FULL_50_16 TaxID=1817772 RepID=A0A1F6G9H0_9PROT|nr:MAG: hypothetical protein A2527_06085 [Candidatus Lambdaproteobacteria bacterium RIFOXYD2_FULL_50_16]